MLGQKIRQLRIVQGLTQHELAQKLYVSKQTVSNWGNDNLLPSINMLVRIASFFCTSTDYLLGLTSGMDIGNTAGLAPHELDQVLLLINDLRNKQKDPP